jgi:hypothetical protein
LVKEVDQVNGKRQAQQNIAAEALVQAASHLMRRVMRPALTRMKNGRTTYDLWTTNYSGIDIFGLVL